MMRQYHEPLQCHDAYDTITDSSNLLGFHSWYEGKKSPNEGMGKRVS